MAGGWDADDEYLSGPAAVSLPTPEDTPYRTSSRASKRSRRSVTPPGASSSPPPMPSDRGDRGAKRSSKDIATDETISILDPRRFTPTLHASLVSEILALRRDQDEKTKVIENLETTLHNTTEQHESLQQNAVATAKENRSLKRQLALLEGGTSSALGELARERDEASDLVAETKKRLDAAQKKLRSQEDDSQRVHDLLAQEKDGWEDERRKYERKIHIAESRLKVVLDEVAAFQAAHANGAIYQGAPQGHNGDADHGAKDADATSVRTMSITNSVRHSLINVACAGQLNGHSLADELNFDGVDEDQSDLDGRESAFSNYTNHRHTRTWSRESIPGRMHLRNQSLESLQRPGSVARSKLFMNQSVLEALEGEGGASETTPAPKISFVHVGVQYSPPPSPKTQAVKRATPEPGVVRDRVSEIESPSRQDAEIEANQSRKRVQIRQCSTTPFVSAAMVSTSSQTIAEPPRPPTTESPQEPVLDVGVSQTTSSSTQTEPVPSPERPGPRGPMLGPPLPIPTISVQPPTSRPTTPREQRLPAYIKHFGCQVNISLDVSTSDASAQTEGIQIDKRLALLPPHLQPSAISSRPVSPNVAASPDPDRNFSPVPNKVPPRNPRRLTGKRATDVQHSPTSTGDPDEQPRGRAPGHDEAPFSYQSGGELVTRPERFSSLFAGFNTASSDEADEFGDAELSDSEYRTALSAPRPPSATSYAGQRSSAGTRATSPEQAKAKPAGRNTANAVGTETYSSFSLPDKETVTGRWTKHRSSGLPQGQSSRASIMRKAAMIQSGIASQQGRSRSPSMPEAQTPPFPIPTRASSRRPPWSASAPSDGQRSPTRADSGQHRRSTSRGNYRPSSVRKVRSAAALPRHHRYSRRGSRSPPPLSPSTEAPESPGGIPPLPRNDITTPITYRERGSSGYRRHRQQASTNTDNTNNTDPVSVASASQTTGVVDAIAQAMVGEWMFKYVRRRKSFGVGDNGAKDENNNDRHKRWVWLAPYERAILWSSKQPSSGSALLGKTGRKLIIQSVLDVKDDNPAPKGASTIFNRSILILTPQRALKFTAVSSERHYVWLTALSFLAHSSQAVPEIRPLQSQLLPKQQMHTLPEFEAPRFKNKRPGIRDSIRLAKGRTGMGGSHVMAGPPSIPSGPSSHMSDVASYRGPESIGAVSSSHMREQSRDTAAEAPFIPRFHDRAPAAGLHNRKRSNTGGHVPPPLSFRGFSGPMSSGSMFHGPSSSTAGASVGTTGSSDIYQSQASSNMTWGMSQTASQRTSEASSRPSNFFDAIGTVRMEAFISPLSLPQFAETADEHGDGRRVARRRSKDMRRRGSRSKARGDGYTWRGRRGTADSDYGASKTACEEDFFRDDPFRGF